MAPREGGSGPVRFLPAARARLLQELFVLVLKIQTCRGSSRSRLPLSGNRSSKTFKPKKNIPEGSHQYELLKHAEATLGSGNLRLAVTLPEGEDLNEWVAVNSKAPPPEGT